MLMTATSLTQVSENIDGEKPGAVNRETRKNRDERAGRRADTNSDWKGDRCRP